MRRANWFAALMAVAASATGCLMPTMEEDGAQLGIAWDCQTGTPEEIAACKADPIRRYPGQTKFESAASWRHMWRDSLLESARSGEAKQVIEESDIYKVDGDTLYALNPDRGLFVIDIANADSPRILAREPVYGYPQDMYVRGGRAYIMYNDYYTWDYDDNKAFQGAQIVVVGIELSQSQGQRRAHTQVVGQYGVDGWMIDSRLVYEDGGQNRARLYVVASDYRWTGDWWDEDESNDTVVSNTNILSLNVTDPANIHEADRLTVNGYGHLIQATTDWIFIAQQDWTSKKSQIKAINIQDRDGDIAEAATVEVDGYLREKFDMDFSGNRLRVVSHDWNWDPNEGSSGDIHITTYDAANMMTKGNQLDLVGVGSLEAARFAGDLLYVVHVQRIDPIEIIDLSNPAQLKSLGSIEIPGWLEHLEIRGETILGLGYDQAQTAVPQRRCEGYTLDGNALAADAAFPEVAADSQRLSLSTYDVSDPAAVCEASRTRFGSGDWPSADFSDYKALRFFDSNADGTEDLYVIPWSSWSDEENQDSNEINAVSLLDVDLASRQVKARGQIESIGSIERSFPAHDRLMALGSRELVVANIADRDHPAVTARLEMARNVQAFAVAGSFGVQLINDWDSPAAELRVVSIATPDAEKGAIKSSIELRDANGAKLEAEELYVNGRTVTVLGREWKYEEFDDNNDGETDRYVDNFQIRFTNYQISAQGQIAFGGTLMLPLATEGRSAAKFANLHDVIRLRPSLFAVSAPDGLFRAVSTAGATPTVTHTEEAPYGDYGIEDLKTFNNKLYVTTYHRVERPVEEAQEEVETGVRDGDSGSVKAVRRQRPRADRIAYFVTRIDLNAQGVPTKAAFRVNTPGRLIDVTKSGNQETWTLLDSRWNIQGEDFEQTRAIFTVQVNTLSASLLDGAQVGNGVDDIQIVNGDGGRAAYLVDNNSWSGPIVPLNADGTPAEEETKPRLIIIDLTNPQALTETARFELPGHYAYLRNVAQLGADRYAFVSLGWGGGLGVVDVTRSAAPTMAQFVRSNGGSWDIIVNTARREAYFAAGMFGVQIVKLPSHAAGGAAQ